MQEDQTPWLQCTDTVEPEDYPVQLSSLIV